jgi:lysocardiolipin and lysophospholipid acyltransferase
MYARDLLRSSADLSSIVATQFFGVPLYWLNRDLYYAYMALTKQSFGIFVTTLTQWWAPTPVRVSGDASLAGQIKRTGDGRVELDFPERVVLIGNHQVGTKICRLGSC